MSNQALLIMCLLGVAGCFPTRSEQFACSTDADCITGRACERGFCVTDDEMLNAEIDAMPPPVDEAVGVDAPIDARPCVGGTARTSEGGSCLVYFSQPKTFANATADCVAQNMHLSIVKTSTRNAAIQGMVAGVDAWLGATDTATEGVFLWSDNSGLTFTNFRAGEPNGSRTENCLVIEGARGGSWDDRNCGQGFGYVCEFE